MLNRNDLVPAHHGLIKLKFWNNLYHIVKIVAAMDLKV